MDILKIEIGILFFLLLLGYLINWWDWGIWKINKWKENKNREKNFMKYKKQVYVNVLSALISFLEGDIDLIERFIYSQPQADREILRDLFNQY